MKIIIVDDNKQFREGFRYFLETQKKLNVIAEAENGKQATELTNINEADIIFMDIEMPGINGIEASKKILRRNNNVKIIAVTMYTEKTYMTTLIEAGFKGCVFKNNLFDDTDNAIKEVMEGRYYFPENIKT